MPELPEVETVKEQLKKDVMGKTITQVKVLYNGIIEYPDVKTFIKELHNQTINNITRQGKWLIFELDDYFLLSHLRMEGKYSFTTKDKPLHKHDYIIFSLTDDLELRYQDTRKFGKMQLYKKDQLHLCKPLNELGLEPFDDKLTASYLKNKFKSKTIPIKNALLDQKIITGIGNIYVNEILFLSKINPLRKTNEINEKKLNTIIKNTKEVLTKAIKAGGTTVKTYTWKDNHQGMFQQELLVYDKKDQPCSVCKTPIIKMMVNNRGTYYCPKCQK